MRGRRWQPAAAAMSNAKMAGARTNRRAWSGERDTASDVYRVSLEKLDRNALRAAQEADLDAGPRHVRLGREFDALRLQRGDHGVEVLHEQPEMVEALIGRHRRDVDAVASLDRSDEDIAAAELHVDARLALLRRADHLGAEHALEPLGRPFRIGRTQMNVVEGDVGHDALLT